MSGETVKFTFRHTQEGLAGEASSAPASSSSARKPDVKIVGRLVKPGHVGYQVQYGAERPVEVSAAQMHSQHPRELAAFERKAARVDPLDLDGGDLEDIPADGDTETPSGMPALCLRALAVCYLSQAQSSRLLIEMSVLLCGACSRHTRLGPVAWYPLCLASCATELYPGQNPDRLRRCGGI